MSFQVGDVVVCVKLPARLHLSKPIAPHRDMPAVRATYRVSKIVTGYDGETKTAIGLNFIGMNPAPYIGYHAGCYRKVARADESFAESIKACRPAHRKTPVSA